MVTLTWLTTATIHLVQIYLDENSLSKENQPESFVQLTKPTFCLYSIHAIGNGDIEGVIVLNLLKNLECSVNVKLFQLRLKHSSFVDTSDWCIAAATASTMGSIMATVAVFEIHIDKKAVVVMNPSMIILGDVPTRMRILSAIRRWRPECSTPMAIMRPPRNIKFVAFM